MPLHTHLTQGEAPYPHMGRMLEKRLYQKGFTKLSLCKALGIGDTGVTAYCHNASLQAGILWKAGLVMKHNFFAELAEHFPYPPTEGKLLTEIGGLKARVAELEKEIAIYEKITGQRK